MAKKNMDVVTRLISVKFLITGIVAIGILSIGMIVYSQWLTSHNFDLYGIENNTSSIRLARKAQQEVTTAHPWSEETLAGDQRRIYAINTGIIIVLSGLFSAMAMLITWNRRVLDAEENTLEKRVQQRTAKLVAREAAARQRNRQQPGNSRCWSSLNKKVLVVDDNEVNLLVAQRMLEELGFEVDLAANGREAIDAATGDDDYAAIFIDSQMPGMDGNEATRIIRLAEGDERNTPIIALTTNTMAPDREKAFAAGVDDYLCKPVFLEDLEVVLDRLLAGDEEPSFEVFAADLQSTR